MRLKSGFYGRRLSPGACVVAVFILLADPWAWCAGQPSLQGSYRVVNATSLGTEVHLTLELSLFNVGDADIVAANLVLRDSLLLMKEYGTLALISLRAGESVTLRGEFTIPQREYDLWQKGRPPNFFWNFGDSGVLGLGQKLVLHRLSKGLHTASVNHHQTQIFDTTRRAPRLPGFSPSSLLSRHPVNTASKLQGMTSSASSSDLITTIAGGGPNNIPALNAGLGQATNAVADNLGNLYVADFDESRIYKVDTEGVLTIVAGNGYTGFSGDGGLAVAAELFNPYAVAIDPAGNIFIADSGNGEIRKVDSSGVITTVFSCTSALCGFTTGVTTDSSGNLFISLAGFGNRGPLNYIVKIDSSGNVTTVAGTGTAGYSGDGGPATSADLNSPSSVALDSSGNVFIADFYNDRVRKVDTNGMISTVAGNGTAGYSGDGGPATNAELHNPSGVLVDNSGNLLIADWGNNRIRKVNASGVISTVAGNGTAGYSGDGGPATSAELNAPFGLHADSSGNLYIGDSLNFVIRKVNSAGVITTVAGNGSGAYYDYLIEDPWVGSFGGDGNAATSAELAGEGGVALDSAGNLFIADSGNNRIRKIDSTGKITTVAGDGSGADGGPAISASLSNPTGVALDSSGNLFIAEYGNARVRKVDTKGVISTVAGSGGELAGPASVAVDAAQNIFIADSDSNRIFKVDTGGTLTVVAGIGSVGYSGDGGPATSAALNTPSGVAVDGAGNLFIADYWNAVVRKVDQNGIITTFAGDGSMTQCGGTSPIVGDGGPATSAALCNPIGLAVDANGDVFISDHDEQVIRKVDTSGIISTVAGTPNYCLCIDFSGDGGLATVAVLDLPAGIAVKSSGDVLYIADLGDNRIREVYPPSSGFLLSLAENGSGAGTVVSIPDGISCGSTCSANFPSGLALTLNAYPAAGSSFYGWSGACSGLGACSVPRSGDQSVTATFNLGPPPDFSVAAASQSLSLHPGSQTTDVITVAPQNGSFGGLVQLSCAMTGSTPLATCSLSPTSLTPGAASATSTLTVNAPAQSARLMTSIFYAALMPISLALIGFSLGSSKSTQRKRPPWLLYSFLVAFVVVQAACGGSHPVQPKNYTVTITAASGAIQHTTQVTVTVQ